MGCLGKIRADSRHATPASAAHTPAGSEALGSGDMLFACDTHGTCAALDKAGVQVFGKKGADAAHGACAPGAAATAGGLGKIGANARDATPVSTAAAFDVGVVRCFFVSDGCPSNAAAKIGADAGDAWLASDVFILAAFAAAAARRLFA